MRKHAAPTTPVFSRPGTYLAAAAATSGLLLGAATAPVAAVAAVGAALLALAAIPAPGTRSPRRRNPVGYITLGVYVRLLATLSLVLIGLPKPPRERRAEAGAGADVEAGTKWRSELPYSGYSR